MTETSPSVAAYCGQEVRYPAKLDIVEGARLAFADFLYEHGVMENDVSSWLLVLTEAVVNAIKHGCAGLTDAAITIAWEAASQEICLIVEDPGQGPKPELWQQPALPKDPLAVSGRGLYLIASFADGWEHWRSDKAYRLVVRKKHPVMPTPKSIADLLDKTLEELSNSYENLSAFYRLGDGLARAESLLDFIDRALKDLERTISNDHLSISFNKSIVEAVGADFDQNPSIIPQESLGTIQKRVLNQETEYIWESAKEVSEDKSLQEYMCGVCFPIQAGGSTRGLITVARKKERPFLSGELNTIHAFADIVGIAVLNARNTVARSREARALRELEIASEIQKTLLPLPQIPSNPLWHLTTRREGAREVAGDYVGAEMSPNGDLYLVIVDVMGKGVSASFLAGMFRTAFTISLSFQYSLVGLMGELNRTLVAQLGELTMFATCALVRIPAVLDRIELVNAGHCPAVLMRADGKMEEVPSSGPPLGIFPEADYSLKTLPLISGDKLFLVTDGLYEWQEAGKAWDWNAFMCFLSDLHGLPGEEVWERLRSRMAETTENQEPADDRTFLCWDFAG